MIWMNEWWMMEWMMNDMNKYDEWYEWMDVNK